MKGILYPNLNATTTDLLKMNSITNDEQQPKPVPLGAVMGLLKQNTAERNSASTQLHYAEIKIRESKEGHFATLGRLVKYEGLPIIEEALDYAKKSGLFVECESKWVGVKTVVKNYTTKSGKTQLAHYTIYDKFLEYVKKGDEQPKSYKGYFLYTAFAERLEQYRNNSVQSFKRVADLFDFTEKPAVAPEPPAPEPVVVNTGKTVKIKVKKPKPALIIEEDEVKELAFVSVPAPSDTECGVKNGKIYIPFCRMGAIGKDGLLFAPASNKIHYHNIPDKFDLAWFEGLAKRFKEFAFADYHGFSFQRNIIEPNLDKIASDLGVVSENVKERIGEDCYIFLNSWFDEAFDEEEGIYLPCGKTFLMEEVEY